VEAAYLISGLCRCGLWACVDGERRSYLPVVVSPSGREGGVRAMGSDAVG